MYLLINITIDILATLDIPEFTGKFWWGKFLANHTGKTIGEEKFGK